MSNYNLNFIDKVTEISNIVSDEIITQNLEVDTFTVDSITVTGNIETTSGDFIADIGDVWVKLGNVILDGFGARIRLTNGADIVIDTGGHITFNDTGGITMNSGDITSATGKLVMTNGTINTVNGDISSTNGDIFTLNGSIGCVNGTLTANNTVANNNVLANEVIASVSNSLGSLGFMLVSSGNFNWPAAAISAFSIEGLNGVPNFGYKLIYFVSGFPTSSSSYIGMRFNNDANPRYSTRITQNTSGLINNSGQTILKFITWNSNAGRRGSGSADFITPQAVTTGVIQGSGISSTSQAGGSFPCQNYKSAWKYQTNNTNITIMNFNMPSSAHNGWTLDYRLYRFT